MSDELNALHDLFDKTDSNSTAAAADSISDNDESDENEFNPVASDPDFDENLIKTLVDADRCARNVLTEDNEDNSRMIR